MSLEQAINDHASAIRELAAAIKSAFADTITTTHAVGELSVTKTERAIGAAKTEEKKDTPKEKAAAGKPAASSQPGAKPQTTAPADAAPTITYDAIKVKILALAKDPDAGRDKCGALLARYGVTKGPDLKPEQYAEFDADITRILAGEFDPRDAEPAIEEEDAGMA